MTWFEKMEADGDQKTSSAIAAMCEYIHETEDISDREEDDVVFRNHIEYYAYVVEIGLYGKTEYMCKTITSVTDLDIAIAKDLGINIAL